MDIFLQQLDQRPRAGRIYALVALGYTMVYGILGLINFAHGDIVHDRRADGAHGDTALAGSGVALPGPAIAALGLLVAMPVCMLLGYSIERVAYRPLRARAAACAAHHRDRRLDRAAERGDAHLGQASTIRSRDSCPPTPRHVAGATVTDLQVFIFLLACAIMAGLLSGSPHAGWAARCAPPSRTRRWRA